jgi:hypothetical protein
MVFTQVHNPAIDRLPQQSSKAILFVLALSHVTQLCKNHRNQAKGLIKHPISQQFGVPDDLSSIEFKLQFSIKNEPQSVLACFTQGFYCKKWLKLA